jgi:putative hydrolase of the HAD superfamily
VRAMVAAGLDFDEDEVFAELLEVIAEFSSNYAQHFNKLVKRLDPAGERTPNVDLVVAAGVSAYHDTKFRSLEPFDDVAELLTYARERGWIVGVLSHGWTNKQAEKLVRLGLAHLFDPNAIFISEKLGINKPNPKLYVRAAEELGLAPTGIIYVGDSPAHDVAPARSLGMTTVWARRASKWQATPEQVGADYVVDSFVELLEILRRDFAVPAPG